MQPARGTLALLILAVWVPARTLPAATLPAISSTVFNPRMTTALAAADTNWDNQSQGVLLRFAPACLIATLALLVLIAAGLVLAKVLQNRHRRL